jgi:hypothetical protein
MANNRLITIIILAIIVIVGIVAALIFMQPQGPQTTTGDKATKLAFYNNGTTWLHLDVVMENVTLKNGSVQNFYAQIFLQPTNGTAVIDLSNLAGYGNEKLPPGTNITVLAWKGLFMPAGSTPSVGDTADLNLNMQGWSNTGQPGSTDTIYNVFYPQLNITQLPSISGNAITNDTVIIRTAPSDFDITPEIADTQEPIFEQEIVSVDQNGKVTITIVQAPTLCSLMAHIV